MRLIKVSTVSVKEGKFVLCSLMYDDKDNTNYYKEREISDRFALRLIKSEQNTGALASRFSKGFAIANKPNAT